MVLKESEDWPSFLPINSSAGDIATTAFPESRLGRLPGEIREMIYGYVLVALPSQSTRYLRVPIVAAADSNVAPGIGPTADMVSLTGSANTQQIAPVNHVRPPKVSYLAILQTCRQINREAYHSFFAKNSLHVTNAPDFIAFLTGIGPLRQAEFTPLHFEGLVVDQDFWTKDVLDSYCLENNIGFAERKECEADRCLARHPTIDEASKLLDDCKNLSRLLLELRTDERLDYLLFLWANLGRGRPVVYLADDSHWVIRWLCTEDNSVACNYKTIGGLTRLQENGKRIQHAIQLRRRKFVPSNGGHNQRSQGSVRKRISVVSSNSLEKKRERRMEREGRYHWMIISDSDHSRLRVK